MSYDLDFWRYKPGVVLEHQAVYEQLCEGSVVEGLEELPIDQILARLKQEFADWEEVGDKIFDGGSRGAFEITMTPQFFRIDCRGMDGEDMNRFIDVANEFNCPLFDPQVGKRFDA